MLPRITSCSFPVFLLFWYLDGSSRFYASLDQKQLVGWINYVTWLDKVAFWRHGVKDALFVTKWAVAIFLFLPFDFTCGPVSPELVIHLS